MKTKLLTSLLSLSFAISASAAWKSINELGGTIIDVNSVTDSNSDISNLSNGLTSKSGDSKWYSIAPIKNADDYFADGGSPITIIFDLGSDMDISAIAVWGYDNGGSNANKNFLKDFSLSFATNDEGTDNFQTSISHTEAFTTQSSAYNVQQNFDFSDDADNDLTVTARYIQMTITDNWADAGTGGDRVGSVEIQFDVEEVNVIPEPSALTLLGLGGLGLVLRRRRA